MTDAPLIVTREGLYHHLTGTADLMESIARIAEEVPRRSWQVGFDAGEIAEYERREAALEAESRLWRETLLKPLIPEEIELIKRELMA